MTTYTLTQNEFVVLDGATYFDPSGDSAEAAAYALWLADGNTPSPYSAPPPAVPYSVPKAKAKIVLARYGLLAPLLAHINALPDDDRVKIAFLDITEWERDSPTLIALAKNELGLTDQQIDAFYIEADAEVL